MYCCANSSDSSCNQVLFQLLPEVSVSRLTPLELGKNSISSLFVLTPRVPLITFVLDTGFHSNSCLVGHLYITATRQLLFILKELTMLYVRFGVLIVFAGLFTTDAQLVNRVAAHLGGDVTFDINGAVNSQCQTHEGRMVVCLDGTTMEGIGQEFQNRISGSCDHIKLKDVQKGDLNHMFICENLDPLKPASYTYSIKATTAPPQNVSLSVNGSKVSVFWQPPPAHWQTGPILEYEVKCSCNAPELLMNKMTVAGTSTVLEGLPQGVRCTVSVAAVTSDGVQAWSEPLPVKDNASSSSQNTGTDTPPVEEGKLFLALGVSVPILVFLAFLVFLFRNSVSGFLQRRKPNAEQRQNCNSPVDTTELRPLRDVEENPTQTQTTDHMLSGSASPRSSCSDDI